MNVCKVASRIRLHDNKGKVYIYNKVKDTFVLRCNLLNILGGSIVLNELLVDEKGNFWLAMDKGLYCLSASADRKEIVREKAKGRFILNPNRSLGFLCVVRQREIL